MTENNRTWTFWLLLVIAASACLGLGDLQPSDFKCPDGARLVHGDPLPGSDAARELGVTAAEWCEKEGKKEGLYRERYPNGQLYRTIDFRNGKIHGLYRLFFEDGKKRMESYYEDGLRSGRTTIWHEEGGLSEVADYEIRDGDVYGRFTSWDKEGNKVAEGARFNQERHGRWVIYMPDGTVRVKKYVKGQRIE